jgi:uncharacterized protein (DUF1800 family)
MRYHIAPALIISAVLVACAPAVQGTMNPAPAAAPSAPLGDADRARQALSRLTYGARPADLAAVERMGVNAWVEQQLHPERIPDRVADSVLDLLDITHKTAFELTADHPQANEFGLVVVQQQKVDTMMKRPNAEEESRRASLALKINQARAAAIRELPTSILLRAVLSERQLLEVMTAFWENHFSVSSNKMPNPWTLVEYDRTIRAHALGKFRDLLGAVATSPAMLFYLDNYQSFVDSLHPTAVEWRIQERRTAHPPFGDTSLVRTVKRRRTGLNENYARELMELHTLGVDGGYSQRDVQEVARSLTGWGIDNFPTGGTFLFQTALHDAGEKTVLGVRIPGGRGVEDGEQVLDILARHPSTARFIARKLVIHFVSDSAPPALVERVAQTYLKTDGDIREILRAVITSPEFNSQSAYRAKVKTPFQLVASILRVMNAAPDTTPRSVQLLARLGQPIFGRETPDGWPDQAAAWMNTGALLNRVNLGAQVAANQMPNVTIAKWQPARELMALGAEQQVDAVVAALLAGKASAETRTALLAIETPPHTLQHVGELVSTVLGSSDFQRR